MISFNRKACKVLFQAACIIVVAFMVGYWFYKFEIEDRDIGVVDYVSLTDAKEIKFPIVSWCLKKPFIDEKLKATNSSITSTAYGQYLEGKIYDKSFEQVDYPNVTIDLNRYFKWGRVWYKNGTYRIAKSDKITFVETFTGFDLNNLWKCYRMNFVVDDQRYVKKVSAYLNRTRLNLDWQGKTSTVHYVIHYPNQFFLLKYLEMGQFNLYSTGITGISIVDVEILKQRNSRNRKCSKDVGNYDDTIIDKILHKTGCHPPYLHSHKTYPQCKIQKDIKESKIRTLARHQMEVPKACERISKARKNLIFKPIANLINHDLWILMITYPEEVKIITQSQDVDVHSLIGNIGGYLGLFLGKVIFLKLM